MATISVVVPVYKAEDFLPQCIESILQQTFTDLELILVDDGSPDRCGMICDEYAQKDSRIKVIHQCNKGQAAARNCAAREATGDWLCFVDSDDIIHPQMLEILYQGICISGAGISMCAVFEGSAVPADFWQSQGAGYHEAEPNEKTLKTWFECGEHKPWIVCGKLISKEIVLKIPFTEGRIYEDNAVVCQWLVAAGRIADTEAKLYFYRFNPTGTTKSEFHIKHLDYLWALEEMITFFAEIDFGSLRKRFFNIYLLTASEYYRRARDELQKPDLAYGIRKQMRKLNKKNRSFISLPYEQKVYIYTLMYPRIMKIYCSAHTAISVLKQMGFLRLLRKTFGYLWRIIQTK